MYVVPAASARGLANVAVCQPVAVSPVKVTLASRVPVDDQIDPRCTPVLPAPLKNRIWVTVPA